jgi:aminoglycoside 3-N-acetyltransferase I
MNPSFEIKRLAREDLPVFKSLIRLFNAVFEEDKSNIGDDENLASLLDDDNFIVMAALHNNEVVGGLTAYELPLYYSRQSEIFLYDLVVNTGYQRKGVGRRLIQKLQEYCAENNIQEFFVLAHEEDAHAIEFYRATGGKSEQVVNFLYEATKE